MQYVILCYKTKLTLHKLSSVHTTAVGPLKATLLTVKLNFIVLVSRHTEQADIPSVEGSVGHKASAGATRSFQRQQEPVARCRAVHFNVSRAAQFLSNKVAKPFLGRSKQPKCPLADPSQLQVVIAVQSLTFSQCYMVKSCLASAMISQRCFPLRNRLTVKSHRRKWKEWLFLCERTCEVQKYYTFYFRVYNSFAFCNDQSNS